MTEVRPAAEARSQDPEWAGYRSGLDEHRAAVESMFEMLLLHDRRRAERFNDDTLLSALIDEAVCWVDAHSAAKPAGISARLWLHKLALTLLDERLENEAVAAGGRFEEANGSETQETRDIASDPIRCGRWLQVLAAIESVH